ncbi:CRISPR-associated endonuclease Cas3'' [Bifidobacterium pseudolongum]|nr:CRISPR-associated endonuclease Cas3'' [Bifidobacterium pseudolongum]
MTRAGYSSIDELPLSAQARSLWGKTDRDAGEQWLPLYVHMSDSALVAKQIWDEWLPEGTRKIIADEFDGDAVLARKTTMFLAGIHDLGKATPVFQSKPITYAPNAADGSMAWIPEKVGLIVGHFDNPNNPTHPLAGEFLLERYLKSIGWSKNIARSYASIVGSHHGKPPIERKLGELEKSYLGASKS